MPIVNPEDEIREGLSRLNPCLSPVDNVQPHKNHKPAVHTTAKRHHGHSHKTEEVVAVEIPLQSQASKSIVDLLAEISRNEPDNEIMTNENPMQQTHRRNAITGDSPQLHLSSSMTHIRIYDIEVNEAEVNLNADDITNEFNSIEWPEQKPYGHDTLSVLHEKKNKLGVPKDAKTYNPIMTYLRRQRYKVAVNLKNDWRVQAAFFTKVMLVKAFQLLLINIWILVVGEFLELRAALTDNHNWFYFPLAVFFAILTAVRLVARTKSNWHPAISITGLILTTICIAYVLAEVFHKYENASCIATVAWILCVTFFLLAFVPYLTRVPITANAIPRTGGVLLLPVAVIGLVIIVYAYEIDVTDYATENWVPALLISEAVLWVTVFEVQRVIWGCCFNVSERRWLFASLYV